MIISISIINIVPGSRFMYVLHYHFNNIRFNKTYHLNYDSAAHVVIKTNELSNDQTQYNT